MWEDVLTRIREALSSAERIFAEFTPGSVEADEKLRGDPVTAADNAVDQALLELLPREGEGWLSEETIDDRARLEKSRVWVVDPLDGTREFVSGIPEWCVSIGYVVDGVPVAGGIFNPATGERFLGARGEGVLLNDEPTRMSERARLEGGLVLASRSEVNRGEWDLFKDAAFTVRPMGSVAYKLALVAAGRADATWTVVPKHEWDVAAGTALVLAAGGSVYEPNEGLPLFNSKDPLLSGLVAHPGALAADVKAQVSRALRHRKERG